MLFYAIVQSGSNPISLTEPHAMRGLRMRGDRPLGRINNRVWKEVNVTDSFDARFFTWKR